ncbi:MAG TPA: hypothetical protein VN457_06005, partial [Chlamydiales bacterium]|nr:hypothetical protein [Chlamydiales bacterium]
NAGEVTISLSDPFSQNEKQVARPIMAILSSLTSGQVSEPVLQRTREGTPVMRIYILDEKKISTIAALPFEEMVDALKQQIAAKRQKKEMDDYFARLRRHFGVREEEIAKDVPSNFEPYVIQ